MKTLHDVNAVAEMITQGKTLMLAGDESLLRQLPRGSWIGGTIPYFMGERGGVMTHELLQVVELPSFVRQVRTRRYRAADLAQIPGDYPKNGASLIVIPAQTEVLQVFARDCSSYDGIFDRPLVGWIAGVELSDLGKVTPKVFDGQTGDVSVDEALVMHFELPDDKHGAVSILNLFSQGAGDTLTFPETGFEVKECQVNGAPRNLAEYLVEKGIDTRLPLVADYLGAQINVSFQSVDLERKNVVLYAPVFPLIEYKIAAPVADYERQFAEELEKTGAKPAFACNCILNYLYANLEGKKTGNMVGPITFGEVAYMLLNQTMVYLTFEDH